MSIFEIIVEQLSADAFSLQPAPPPKPRPDGKTLAALRAVSGRVSCKTLAATLGMSANTVRLHLTQLRKKGEVEYYPPHGRSTVDNPGLWEAL